MYLYKNKKITDSVKKELSNELIIWVMSINYRLDQELDIINIIHIII